MRTASALAIALSAGPAWALKDPAAPPPALDCSSKIDVAARPRLILRLRAALPPSGPGDSYDASLYRNMTAEGGRVLKVDGLHRQPPSDPSMSRWRDRFTGKDFDLTVTSRRTRVSPIEGRPYTVFDSVLRARAAAYDLNNVPFYCIYEP